MKRIVLATMIALCGTSVFAKTYGLGPRVNVDKPLVHMNEEECIAWVVGSSVATAWPGVNVIAAPVLWALTSEMWCLNPKNDLNVNHRARK